MKRHRPARFSLLLVLLVSLRVQAAGLDEKGIDHVATRALDAFEVPGMAVAVVRNSETIFLKGYGLRDVERGLPTTPRTYFRIGSTSKAFTSAALALLVQDGRLGWDDKVTEHLPGFSLYDPGVTRAFSVRDLLTHRSGLWSGAGDYMLWPAPSGFSRAEVVANLRHFKPVAPFGSSYAYSNALYVAAGELIAGVTGTPYETFVQTRLMEPLGVACFAGEVPDEAMTDAAEPYVPYQGRPLRVDRNRLIGRAPVMAAAGGITCNAQGMARWMSALLAGGEGVLSPRQIAELWTGITKMPVSARERERDATTHRAYALGWRIADMHGFETVSHTGTLLGFQSQVMLVPAKGLGIAVLTNGTNTRARSAVMQALLASWLAPDVSPRDWIVEYTAPVAAPRQMPQLTETVDLPLKAYTGTYADTWFGTITVSAREDGGLGLASSRMPALAGAMIPRSGHEFLVKWYDPTVDADFLARFEPGADGSITGLRLASTAGSGDRMSDLEVMHFLRSGDTAR
ncbi:MAG: serine hydrolase [Halieaceae bacterium]|jgi:CubicO group peptidase (beta-lactamase class C family)|nr:serine hydrolase [Halieaceae bacterium]